ncbi:hemolysin family protein [bacterium]|nr:hemolysin family protein [bacterium]
MNYIVVIVLLVFSGIFSGLTIGLMSLNSYELRRKAALGNKDAAKIQKIRERGNLLLCTLIIGNVAMNSALSVFLGSITTGIIAGIIATVLIVVFTEITPQAIFTRHALLFGARFAPFVRIFVFVLYPICYPLSRILDRTLGEELPEIYSKRELVKIIEEHEDSPESGVKAEEERIVRGALTFSDKRVRDVMTPREVLTALDADTIIDDGFFTRMLETAHSRIPVYQRNPDNIIGVLYLKDLIGEGCRGKKVDDVCYKNVIFVNENRELLAVLNTFLSSHHHLFIVINEFGGVLGIVTLEDILEEIIGAEIVDEDDKHQDMRYLARERHKKERSSGANMV